jgi:hypothetical protein
MLPRMMILLYLFISYDNMGYQRAFVECQLVLVGVNDYSVLLEYSSTSTVHQ